MSGHSSDRIHRPSETSEREQLSRRNILTGLGVAGAAALTAPALLSPSQAVAAMIRPEGVEGILDDLRKSGGGDFTDFGANEANIIPVYHRRWHRPRRRRWRRWRGYPRYPRYWYYPRYRRSPYGCIWTRYGYFCWS